MYHMFQYAALNAISPIGTERFTEDYTLTDNTDEADLILVRSANMKEMTISDKTIGVARAGAGVNNIPLEDYAGRGIVVFNTPGANANGVKEMVFAGMLLAARDIIGGVEWTGANAGCETIAKDTEKAKKQFAGTELSGKKLGVIGLGAIGVLVANAAVHLGMDVYGYDPYISVDAAWNLSRNIKHISDVTQIYKECDFITIHVPLMDATKGMISAEAIASMKPTATILNLARDLLVDEPAVLKALDEGRLHRYVSDFPNTTTAGHKGVILTPHLGASTAESEDNCAKMAVDELRDYAENGNIRNSVNYPACQMGVCSSASRIAICHKNTKKMISQFTSILADTNIANMNNASRGEYAYTLFDLEDIPSEEVIASLNGIDGVVRVRRVK